MTLKFWSLYHCNKLLLFDFLKNFTLLSFRKLITAAFTFLHFTSLFIEIFASVHLWVSSFFTFCLLFIVFLTVLPTLFVTRFLKQPVFAKNLFGTATLLPKTGFKTIKSTPLFIYFHCFLFYLLFFRTASLIRNLKSL